MSLGEDFIEEKKDEGLITEWKNIVNKRPKDDVSGTIKRCQEYDEKVVECLGKGCTTRTDKRSEEQIAQEELLQEILDGMKR